MPAKAIPGYTPRDYLTHWLSQWVREYGIDGFRVDTAKHVELAAWQQLKDQASQALAAWKGAHPDKKLDNAPFWMTGESWGHGVMQSDYYRHGFDAMINFDYQEQAAKAVNCLADIDLTWQQMAEKLQSFNVFVRCLALTAAVLPRAGPLRGTGGCHARRDSSGR